MRRAPPFSQPPRPGAPLVSAPEAARPIAAPRARRMTPRAVTRGGGGSAAPLSPRLHSGRSLAAPPPGAAARQRGGCTGPGARAVAGPKEWARRRRGTGVTARGFRAFGAPAGGRAAAAAPPQGGPPPRCAPQASPAPPFAPPAPREGFGARAICAPPGARDLAPAPFRGAPSRPSRLESGDKLNPAAALLPGRSTGWASTRTPSPRARRSPRASSTASTSRSRTAR
jgi:hypothetical protein